MDLLTNAPEHSVKIHKGSQNRRTRDGLCTFAALSLLLLLLSGCAVLEGQVPGDEGTRPDNAIRATGFLEGEKVTVSCEVTGRVAEILVERADTVSAGDVLLRLDDAARRSQREEAEATIAAAEANLALVLAGARPEELAQAYADLDGAEAQAAGAAQGVIDAGEAITNPQSLNARVHEAESQVALAEQGVEQAEAELAAAQLKRDVYADQGGDIKRTWDLQLDAAEAALDGAQAELAGAKTTLATLYALRANPLELLSVRHAAEAEADVARARVKAEEARLAELTSGPPEPEVSVARAQLAQAQAALGIVDVQLDQLILEAPIDGVVATRAVQVGETATAGQPLLTIVNLDEVKLVIYVAQAQIGSVQVGEPVSVTVDAFPERTFVGQVTTIAGEAEFTPRNVQTSEERANLVFAVDVSIPNPDHALKPGMPADAVLRP